MSQFSEEVTVVTGLPRSGTSMVMRMLGSGGFPLLTDGLRQADEHNPYGYFEFELVKRISHDVSWLDNAVGCAVKVVAPLLLQLPTNRAYAVLFVRRDLRTVLQSQDRMLLRQGHNPGNAEEWLARLTRVENEAAAWCANMPTCRALQLSYEATVSDPSGTCGEVQAFVGRSLDVKAMMSAVVPPNDETTS
jgi:hypothetical protein